MCACTCMGRWLRPCKPGIMSQSYMWSVIIYLYPRYLIYHLSPHVYVSVFECLHTILLHRSRISRKGSSTTHRHITWANPQIFRSPCKRPKLSELYDRTSYNRIFTSKLWAKIIKWLLCVFCWAWRRWTVYVYIRLGTDVVLYLFRIWVVFDPLQPRTSSSRCPQISR